MIGQTAATVTNSILVCVQQNIHIWHVQPLVLLVPQVSSFTLKKGNKKGIKTGRNSCGSLTVVRKKHPSSKDDQMLSLELQLEHFHGIMGNIACKIKC